MNLLRLEPSLITGAVTALLMLLIAFGVPLTDAQKVAIIGVIGPIYALIAAATVRQHVIPTQTLKDANVSIAAVKDQAAVNQEAAKRV